MKLTVAAELLLSAVVATQGKLLQYFQTAHSYHYVNKLRELNYTSKCLLFKVHSVMGLANIVLIERFCLHGTLTNILCPFALLM